MSAGMSAPGEQLTKKCTHITYEQCAQVVDKKAYGTVCGLDERQWHHNTYIFEAVEALSMAPRGVC
jgi:hypothetical protein